MLHLKITKQCEFQWLVVISSIYKKKIKKHF